MARPALPARPVGKQAHSVSQFCEAYNPSRATFYNLLKSGHANSGTNSDELRGKGCKKFMFHIESQNSMYVKTAGRALLARDLVKGKKWFSLTVA